MLTFTFTESDIESMVSVVQERVWASDLGAGGGAGEGRREREGKQDPEP